MIDLLNEILATLRNNRLRTILTGFAVSWGIFLLIVLLSASHGLSGGMNSMFSRNDTQSISVAGGMASKSYKGLSDSREVTLRERDIAVIKSQHADEVTRISADISGAGTISTQKDYINDGYRGGYPDTRRADGLTILEGRFINDNDLKSRRRVMVISDRNARLLFGDTYAIGKTVKMNDLVYTIVGIYTHEWRNESYIPYSTARALAGGDDKVNKIVIGADNIHSIERNDRLEQGLYSTLGNQHSFAPDDRSALWVHSRIKEHLTQNQASGALDIAVWIIGMLTMLSGIVGVSNIMFVSVRERTHEIGVRRAIGARPASILRQIILESVAITTIFGYIGIFLGVVVSQGISRLMGDSRFYNDPGTDLATAFEVTLVLIVAGALAGLFPALKSLKIKPVEALRDE